MSRVHRPPSESSNSSGAPRSGVEAHERLARALTGVLGSFAASATVAARIQPVERAQAFKRMAEGFDERRRAMERYSETLERKEAAPTPVAAFGSTEIGSMPGLPGSAERAPEANPTVAVSVTIPGLKRDVGLGDAVRKLTGLFGAVTCGACARRAERLNRALVFRAPVER